MNNIFVSGVCEGCDQELSVRVDSKDGSIEMSDIDKIDWMCGDCDNEAAKELAADSKYEEMKDAR